VEWAIDQIADRAVAGDQVLIWWSGHGSVDSFDTDSDSISASQLDAALDDITCSEMYIFLGPCYSGSFIDDLDDEQNRAIYTSCQATEESHAQSPPSHHSYWDWATYRAIDPDLNANDADENSDGRVSLYELYEYAYDFVTIIQGYDDQHPDRWVGTTIGLDDNDYIGDGYY